MLGKPRVLGVAEDGVAVFSSQSTVSCSCLLSFLMCMYVRRELGTVFVTQVPETYIPYGMFKVWSESALGVMLVYYKASNPGAPTGTIEFRCVPEMSRQIVELLTMLSACVGVRLSVDWRCCCRDAPSSCGIVSFL